MRIELTPDPLVLFRYRLGVRVRTRTDREGTIVGGRYDGPMPTTGIAFAYAIEYTVRPERGPDFKALEVELERARR